MGLCTAFVFAALVEFTIVNFWFRKQRLNRRGGSVKAAAKSMRRRQEQQQRMKKNRRLDDFEHGPDFDDEDDDDESGSEQEDDVDVECSRRPRRRVRGLARKLIENSWPSGQNEMDISPGTSLRSCRFRSHIFTGRLAALAQCNNSFVFAFSTAPSEFYG